MDLQAYRFQRPLLLVHHLAMASLAFLGTMLVLGGPLGFVPSLCALVTVTRDFEHGASAYRTAPLLWRTATAHWRAGLRATVPLSLVAAAAAFHLAMRTAVSLAVFVVIAAWSLMALNHMALRLSLGLSAWGRAAEWERFLALSWFHLISVLIWFFLAIAAGPVSPLLVPIFGPALAARVLVRLGDSAAVRVLRPGKSNDP